MAAEPLSVLVPTAPSLAALVNVAPTQATNGVGTDNFLALLNGNSNASDNHVSNTPSAASSNKGAKKQDPIAAAIDVATPIVDNQPLQTPAPAAPVSQNAPVNPSNNNQQQANNSNNIPQSQQSNAPQNANPSQNANDNNQPKLQPAPVKTADNAATNNTNSDNTASDANQAEKDLRTQIQNQLSNISQILASMMQALSAATTTPSTAPSTTSSTTTTATTPVATLAVTTNTPITGTDPNAALLAIQATLVPGTDATSTTNTPAAGATNISIPAGTGVNAEVALLSDMQALLQQLQQQLQTGAQTQAPDNSSSATANNGVQTITDSLAKDMANLLQMFRQQPTATTATVTTPDTASATILSTSASPLSDSSGLTDLKSQLKDSIAQVRDQLQQLSTVNDTIFAQAKANFQAQISSNIPTPVINKDTVAATIPAPANNPTNNNTAVPVVQNAPVTPLTITTPVAVAMTAGLDMSQGGANNSSSNNGRDQGAPQPAIAPVTAGQAQAAANISSAPFAKVMAQVSQASVLEQVTFNVKTALGDGSSKIHIQLDPAELGKVDIKLTVDANGKTGVVITADNKDTLNLLQRDTSGLTKALNDAGLTTDSNSLNFSLSGGQQQGQGQANPQAAATYLKAQPDEEEDVSVNSITRSYVVNLAEGLDIKI